MPQILDRAEFIKLALASAESSIRAYDTKAQIASAVFVLSISSAASIVGKSTIDAITTSAKTTVLIAALLVILAFIAVIIPMIKPKIAAISGRENLNELFYVNPIKTNPSTLLSSFENRNLEEELTFELIKLSIIRDRKQSCLNVALCSMIAFYLFLPIFFILTHLPPG